MITSNLINVHTHTTTAKFILYVILERAEYEKKNTFLISQTYIAKICDTSNKTVNRELKYLQEEGYITYKKALYNNLTTTEITLTDKSIQLITPHRTQNKPQDLTQTEAISKTIQTSTETQEIALKPSNNIISVEASPIVAEATTPQAETLQEQYNRLSKVNKHNCKYLQKCNFTEFYVKLAVEDYKIPIEIIEGIKNNEVVIN